MRVVEDLQQYCVTQYCLSNRFEPTDLPGGEREGRAAQRAHSIKVCIFSFLSWPKHDVPYILLEFYCGVEVVGDKHK